MTDAWHITELLAQGSAWKYPWTPTWTDSLWIPASIGIVCIAIVAICYLVELRGVSLSRRAMFTMLRSAAILLIGWMLLGWSWTPYAEEPADLVILIDSSRSMSTEDIEPMSRGQGKKSVSRMESVKSLLNASEGKGLLTQIAKEYRPRVAHFDEQTAWLPIDAVKQRQELRSLTAQGASTRLGDAIHDALRLQRGRPAAAILVISDGVRTEGMTLDSAAAEAKAVAVPLYVVGVGEDRPTRDVRLANLFCPPTAFLGDVINIEADVESEGFAERGLRVQLKGPKENEPLMVESVTLRAGKASSHVRIPIRPAELGEWKFSLEVERPEGDLNAENNLVRGVVRVQEETVRVLLVDRRPRYDIRYLIDLLSRAKTWRQNGAGF